jgi:predicted HicB family RNase H-like nuclease
MATATVSVTIRIPEELHTWLRDEAHRTGESINGLAVKGMRQERRLRAEGLISVADGTYRA